MRHRNYFINDKHLRQLDSRKNLTVGQVRRFLKDLPDDVPFYAAITSNDDCSLSEQYCSGGVYSYR
jgi:hypothetical protein